MQNRPTRSLPIYQMVRLTRFTYERLCKVQDCLNRAIQENPDRYPQHAGRRLTISEIVNLLLDKQEIIP